MIYLPTSKTLEEFKSNSNAFLIRSSDFEINDKLIELFS